MHRAVSSFSDTVSAWTNKVKEYNVELTAGNSHFSQTTAIENFCPTFGSGALHRKSSDKPAGWRLLQIVVTQPINLIVSTLTPTKPKQNKYSHFMGFLLCAKYFELKGWNLSSLIVIHHPRFTRTRKSFHNIIRREILTFETKRNLLGKSRHLAIYLQKLSCCQSDFWIPQLPDQIKISSNLVWNSFSDTQFLKKRLESRHSGKIRSESESSQWKVFIVIAFNVMFFSLREYTVIGKKRRFLSLGSFMKRQAPDNCPGEMNCLSIKNFLWIFFRCASIS